MPTRIRILHLSDLHERVALDWMPEERKAKVRIGNPRRHRVLGPDFLETLQRINTEGAVDLVCFTGDVADWGLKEEYDAATVRLNSILGLLGLTTAQLFVVPGNHDAQRTPEGDKEAHRIFSEVRSIAGKHPNEVSKWLAGMGAPTGIEGGWRERILNRTSAFHTWLASDLGRADLLPAKHPHRSLGYRATARVKGVPIHLIGLNSAWLCGDDNDAVKIPVTEDQIMQAARDASGKPFDGFRIALVHHPLEQLLDGNHCRRQLAETVDLLLHGHQHEPFALNQSDPDRTLRVLAAGSLYEGDEGDQYPNAFNVIDVHLNEAGRPLKYDLQFWGWSSNGHWYPTGAIYKSAPQGRMTWWTALGEGDRPASLPTFQTPFIGRKKEVDEFVKLVSEHQLVTLVGTGGIGKTRIADEVVRRLRDELHDFKKGIFFVDLSHPTQDSDQGVVSAIDAAMGDLVTADNETAVTAALRDHHYLLVLDNFETVIKGAGVIARLLRACPKLHLLVTSQTRLGVTGEEWRDIQPMKIPAPETRFTIAELAKLDGFEFFRDRARAARRDWDVSERSADQVAQVLALTEGIPFKIEIVASHMDENTLDEIIRGFDQQPELQRLQGVGINERHASIGSCIDWSLKLLPTLAQELFPKLSVFAGGFFPDDVQEVCEVDHPKEALDVMKRYSLLQREDTQRGSRFRMLEMAQKYADQKLGASAEQLKRRHAAHFLSILIKADKQLKENEQAEGFARIDADYENILAGIERSRELKDHGTLIQYSSGLADYLSHRRRFVQRLLLAEQAAQAAEEAGDPTLVAATQNNLGNAYRNLPTGDRGANLARAIGCYEAALRVFTERDFPLDWATTQNNLGAAYSDLPSGDRGTNLARAIGCYEAALRVHTEHDFPTQWATRQNNLGVAYTELPSGDRGANLARAIGCYEAALRVRTERDFPLDWAMTQNNLGITYSDLPSGDRGTNLVRAIECYEAALRVRTERDFPLGWAMTQNNLGVTYSDLPSGDRGANLARAIECYEAALRVLTERDFPLDWATTQNNLGNAYGDFPTGDRGANLARAIGYYEAALRVRTERDSPLDWAMTQNNLGTAYADLPTGDREANLARAIVCFEAALRVRTERDFPREWADTEYNLALAYASSTNGKREQNLKLGITCFEAAARGYSAVGIAAEATKALEQAASLKKQLA